MRSILENTEIKGNNSHFNLLDSNLFKIKYSVNVCFFQQVPPCDVGFVRLT